MTGEKNADVNEQTITPSRQQDFNVRTNESIPEEFSGLAHEIFCIALLFMAPALANMSTGAYQIALPKLAEYYNVYDGSLSWSLASLSLACGAFLLFMGSVADTFGRKSTLLISYIVYAIFCLAASFCKNFVSFCIMRAIQGVAAAAAAPAAVGIISTIYDKPSVRKNKAMAAFAGGAPIGYTFGIIGGGIFCQFLSIRAIGFFFTILYGIGALGVWYYIPSQKLSFDEFDMGQLSLKQKLRRFDYGGILLATSSLTILIFSITQANSVQEGWKSPIIISLLIVSIVLLTLFCFYETYIPSHPLLPMSIWKYPSVGLCMIINSCGWMAFNGITVYYCTLYFQKVQGASPILTTAYLAPLPIFGTSVNIFAAFTLHRIPGSYLMIISNIGYTVAALLWALIPLRANYWAMPFPSMIAGVIGADLAYNVGNLHILRSVSPNLQSSAGGLFNTILQLSIAIGIAASSAVVSSIVKNQNTAEPALLLKGYHAGVWLAVGSAALGLALTPFLRIGLQGIEEKTDFINEGPIGTDDMSDRISHLDNAIVHENDNHENVYVTAINEIPVEV